MKKYLTYIYAVILLGTFSGIVTSIGSNIFPAIAFMSIFWACMLTPMLSE